MRLPELGRELGVPNDQMWLLAADLMRVGGWGAVFATGTELTEPAELAIRRHLDGPNRVVTR